MNGPEKFSSNDGVLRSEAGQASGGATRRPTAKPTADSPLFATDEPAAAHRRKPQFGMRGLLLFTTGLCVLFGVLAGLKVGYVEMLIGFVATTVVSLGVILMLEMYLHGDSDRRGRQGALRRRPPPLGHRASLRPRGTMIDLSGIDPTGIEFVDPHGIAYVESEVFEAELTDDDNHDDGLPIIADFADTAASDTEPAPSDAPMTRSGSESVECDITGRPNLDAGRESG
jgi:hypothetical protein